MHSVVSGLGLHYLPGSHKKDARLILVNHARRKTKGRIRLRMQDEHFLLLFTIFIHV